MAAMRLPPKVKFFLANPGLKGLPPADVHRFVQDVTARQLARGEAIWHPADLADSVFFIETGIARVARPGSRGRSLILRFHGRSEMFGIASLYRRERRETHAVAHEPCEVYRVPVEAVERMVQQHRALGERLAALWVQRQDQLERRLAAQMFEPVQTRLILLFQDLARSFGVRDSRGTILTLRLTHRELGDLVGATRETVSAALGALRKKGRIRIEEHRIILLRDA